VRPPARKVATLARSRVVGSWDPSGGTVHLTAVRTFRLAYAAGWVSGPAHRHGPLPQVSYRSPRQQAMIALHAPRWRCNTVGQSPKTFASATHANRRTAERRRKSTCVSRKTERSPPAGLEIRAWGSKSVSDGVTESFPGGPIDFADPTPNG
jgi:hypothetical protein